MLSLHNEMIREHAIENELFGKLFCCIEEKSFLFWII